MFKTILFIVFVAAFLMAAIYDTANEWDEELKEYERMDAR